MPLEQQNSNTTATHYQHIKLNTIPDWVMFGLLQVSNVHHYLSILLKVKFTTKAKEKKSSTTFDDGTTIKHYGFMKVIYGHVIGLLRFGLR